jgi:hypothetical protein
MKSNHKTWVRQRLSIDSDIKQATIKRIKHNIPKHLVQLTTGDEIVNLVANAYAMYPNHNHLESEDQVKTISDFFQAIQDFLDTSEDFGPSYRVEIAFVMTDLVKRLESLGFWAFGASEMQIIEGGMSGRSNWQMAYLHVLHSDNEVIEVSKSMTKSKGDV